MQTSVADELRSLAKHNESNIVLADTLGELADRLDGYAKVVHKNADIVGDIPRKSKGVERTVANMRLTADQIGDASKPSRFILR